MLRPGSKELSLLTIIYAQPSSFFCNLRLKNQSINMATENIYIYPGRKENEKLNSGNEKTEKFQL